MNNLNINNQTTLNASTSSAPVNQASKVGKEDFLKLLSVQLQYQDPLKPMENTDFIAQMAQFSTLEGITNMDKSLTAMASQMLSMNNLSTTDLIDRNVKLYGNDITRLNGENTTLNYQLNENAENLKISVLDANGVEIRSIETGSAPAGLGSYVWDGKNNQGLDAPAGEYKLVINATRQDGSAISAVGITTARVAGVVYEGGTPMLKVRGSLIRIDKLLEILS